MITKELIENFRETVKPFVSQILFGTNYEGMGTLDCVEFERDFDEILDLALAEYEQKVNNAVSTLDGNKNDMVYRQQAIDALDCINGTEEVLRSLPSAQPEAHEGHWIKHETPDGGEQYECSECGVLWEFAEGTPEDNEAYFCPKCGTKMKGVRHEND